MIFPAELKVAYFYHEGHKQYEDFLNCPFSACQINHRPRVTASKFSCVPVGVFVVEPS
jgi:hypothetical protein